MADLAADLTVPQIIEFRQNWIRDQWSPSPVNEGLSEFNKSRKSNFFSDSQLQTVYDNTVVEWAEELEAVKYEKEQERIGEGDSDATAETKGDAIRGQALFRLMRVECRNRMMDDAGYRASLGDGADAVFRVWQMVNAADLAWVRSRSGRFNVIEIERG